jgi:NADPH-dependent 2,4-dienoyl-CoA reductase/sulfur reductase-like enzyme
MAFRVFGLEVATAGLTLAEARQERIDADRVTISSKTRVAAMPGAGRIEIELVFERPSGRILGASLWGAEGTAARVNVLAAAMQKKMTVGEAAGLDLVYAPPFSPLWEPVLIAARAAETSLARPNP